MKTTNKKNIYDIITDRIFKLLSTSGKYQKKWVNTKNGFAINPYTKHVYEGINQILLSSYIEDANFKTNKWLTFPQASELGGRIIKGEKANHIVYFNYTYTLKDGTKITSKAYDQLEGEAKKNVSVNSFLNYYLVFNVQQIEGLEDSFYKIDDIVENSFSPIESLEALANNYVSESGVKLFHAGQQTACYYPELDRVLMPLKDQFISSEGYYKTLFHEFSHSTGHSTRLNRKGITESGNLETYAFEELIAELSTAFINARFGIDTEISNNAAYIKSWLKHLKDDNRFFVKAAGMASKSANYIFKFSESSQVAA